MRVASLILFATYAVAAVTATGTATCTYGTPAPTTPVPTTPAPTTPAPTTPAPTTPAPTTPAPTTPAPTTPAPTTPAPTTPASTTPAPTTPAPTTPAPTTPAPTTPAPTTPAPTTPAPTTPAPTTPAPTTPAPTTPAPTTPAPTTPAPTTPAPTTPPPTTPAPTTRRPGSISTGQTVMCTGARDIYRFDGVSLRHYPTTTIAASWGASAETATTFPCSVLRRGADMNLNPSVLPAGAAIKCSASDTNVYRLVDGGSYRLYPTSEIAASWGASAATATAVECPVLTKGTDMNLNPSGLLVGQAIKCSSAELAIYRLVSNGVYRLYPNPAIALSWDPNMSWIPVVECSVLTKGPEMAANTLTIGSSLKCGQNEAQVYRYDSPGVYRYYPSPSIALSWNPTYYLFTVVDCTVMRRGPDMAKKV